MIIYRNIISLFVIVTVLQFGFVKSSCDCQSRNEIEADNDRCSFKISIQEQLQEFKQELLSDIKRIVDNSCKKDNWGKLGRNCTIKNRRFAEFYYVRDGLLHDSERRLVFTWPPGIEEHESLWNFEFNPNKNAYKIKSAKYNEYLYAGADDLKADAYRRRCFTWTPKTYCEEQCYWDIQLLKNNNQYYTIHNTQYNEYLYALDDANIREKRQVYTWKFDPNHDVQNDHQSHWTINCY